MVTLRKPSSKIPFCKLRRIVVVFVLAAVTIDNFLFYDEDGNNLRRRLGLRFRSKSSRSLILNPEILDNTQKKVDKLKLLWEGSPKLESTIVTAYFSMSDSKHSGEKYLEWFENMACIEDAMVILTTPDLVDSFLDLRSHASNRTLIIAMDLNDIEVGDNSRFNITYWQRQNNRMGYLKSKPNGNLYKIWLAKTWFVNQAINFNPFGSDVYTWMDIGHFRNWKQFCGKTVVRHTELVPNDKMLLFASRPLNIKDIKRESNPIFNGGWGLSYIAGGGFSGRAHVWPHFLKKMDETISLYHKNDVGLQDDQPVLQSTCMRNPGLCSVAPVTQSRKGFFWTKHFLYEGLDSFRPNFSAENHTWDPGMGISEAEIDFDYDFDTRDA